MLSNGLRCLTEQWFFLTLCINLRYYFYLSIFLRYRHSMFDSAYFKVVKTLEVVIIQDGYQHLRRRHTIFEYYQLLKPL